MTSPSVKRANTKIKNTQIHKYPAHDKVPERPSIWYIHEKMIDQGYQKCFSEESLSYFDCNIILLYFAPSTISPLTQLTLPIPAYFDKTGCPRKYIATY